MYGIIPTSRKPHYENVPFEIPESWKWVTLGDISNYGQTKHTDVLKIPEEDWVLELEDIEKDSGRLIQALSRKDRKISGVRCEIECGQILYSKLRTYLNKVLIAPKKGFCTTEIIPFYCFGEINHYYITSVLRSQYFIDYTTLCCYGCKMPRLSTDDARKGMIPLPPIAEQKRIVLTIKHLFLLIDSIDASKNDLQEAVDRCKTKVLDLAIHGKLVSQDPNDEPAVELLKRINPNAPICDTSHYGN
ncbi:MAG: restriction endonuclease subunit S, partial [Bacteroidales bacterium]|nr:restriction endonuclease subunit S [Bacteroidales bacterium]